MYHIECTLSTGMICKRSELRGIYSTSKLSAVFPSTLTPSAQDCQVIIIWFLCDITGQSNQLYFMYRIERNFRCRISLASSPGHSQILSRSRGDISGEGLILLLRHGPEMVDSVST